MAIEDKVRTYQKDLDNVIKQLTAKRSEMAELAKTTVAHLDKSIPELQAKADSLNNRVAELNKVIAEKEGIAAAELKSCKEEYEVLSNKLRASYEAKFDQLDSLIAQKHKAEAVFNQKKHDVEQLLNQREADLNNEQKQHNDRVLKLSKDVIDFENDKKSFFNKASEEKELILDDKQKTKKLLKSIEDDKNYISGKKDEVDSILLRLAEIQNRENSISLRENQVLEDRDRLNEKILENISIEKTNVSKSKNLNLLEQNIKDRERNVKIIEAQMAKG